MKKTTPRGSQLQQKPVLMALLFIITWWSWAFFSQPTEHRDPPELSCFQAQDQSWSPLSREVLRKALCGDWALMRQLMLDWDLDAQLAKFEGKTGSLRLAKSDRLQAERLFRELAGERDSAGRFGLLPQSYFSASVLLAVAEPTALLGLPEGYRSWRAIVPDIERLNQVPRDLNLRSLERIAVLEPQLAFVAPYSESAVVEGLKGLSVDVCTVPYICSVEDCCREIYHVAAAAGRPLHGELLSLFVEAAMLHLQNRLQWAALAHSKKRLPRLVYLHRYVDYTVPGPKTLVSELLRRFGAAELQEQLNATDAQLNWTRPVQLEQLQALQPEIILVNCPSPDETIRSLIYNEPALQQCPAVQRGAIFELDGDLQQSASQFLVLAAYDLLEAISSGMEILQ